MTKRFFGKVVVVTGTADALTREGTRVIATDATETPGCRRLDVTNGKEWAQLAAELRESYDQVHGLVDIAGVTW
ncbi:hypothetical protein [Streptomyces sp. NPDC051554]|uniref:hypothetical protein n=1 Tax=Streptomyces sp. NPDC051554 TaxID=3365656 RepID=UPI003795D5DF